MTATRDRRSDPEIDAGLAWDDRPIIGQFRGLPWWAAVLLAFGVTAIGAFVDMQQQDTLGKIFQGAFVVGCVGAVCFVRRRSLFGPMVQPPLVFAITAVGGVVLLGGKSSSDGLSAVLVSIALPLTSNFPTMGITTAVVVAIGLFRWWRERDPDPEMRPNKSAQERASRGTDGGFADEPGQGTGGRSLRDRQDKDRAPASPRRGRSDPDDTPADDRPGRRMPGRGSRPSRESGGRDGGRDAGRDRDAAREPRRRDAPGTGRADRGRAELPPDNARGRGRGGEQPGRRRDGGAEGGRPRDDRGAGRRDAGRDGSGNGGRDGRGGSPGRQPRRRPPDDYR